MQGLGKKGGAVAALDLLGGVHNHHPGGDGVCKTEIVGDAEQGALPQPLEGILHQGDAPAVQPLGRFIRQNQICPGGDPHGDQYPLAHTAGELKRIAAAQSRAMLQPKGLQQRGRLNQRFSPGTGLMLSNGLAKLVAHGIERIESIPASLRNIGDLFPPDPVELPLPAAQQLAAVEADRAGDPG